ncbi:creatinine amidohydrolase, partial [Klebsiella pneumoniae]
PECVHMERAVANFPPEFPCPTLSKGRPAAAWASYDFGPSGVIGDPTPATREQGERLLDSLAASWAQAIIEIHRMAWVERREPTWGKQHWHGFVQSLPPSFAAESREP